MIRSVISGGVMVFSRPSGISDLPVLAISATLRRRIVCSTPSRPRRVTLAGRLGGDEAGQDAAVVEGDGVFEELGRDLAVGVEDVHQDLLGRPAADARRGSGPTAWPCAPSVWQARHSRSKTDAAAVGVAGPVEGRLVAGDRLGARARGLAAEQSLGPLADRRVAVLQQERPARRRDLAGRDRPGLDRVQERADPGATAEQDARRPRRGARACSLSRARARAPATSGRSKPARARTAAAWTSGGCCGSSRPGRIARAVSKRPWPSSATALRAAVGRRRVVGGERRRAGEEPIEPRGRGRRQVRAAGPRAAGRCGRGRHPGRSPRRGPASSGPPAGERRERRGRSRRAARAPRRPARAGGAAAGPSALAANSRSRQSRSKRPAGSAVAELSTAVRTHGSPASRRAIAARPGVASSPRDLAEREGDLEANAHARVVGEAHDLGPEARRTRPSRGSARRTACSRTCGEPSARPARRSSSSRAARPSSE